MADIAPVGKQLTRRNFEQISNCPLCQQEETVLHIWECQDATLSGIYNQHLQTIRGWLLKGPEELKVFALDRLECIRRHGVDNPRTNINENSLYEQQLQLGTSSFLWGFFHVSWKPLLARFFLSKKQSPTRWLASLTLKFWDLWDIMWDHRNQVKHQPEGTNHENTTVDNEVIEIYQQQPPLQFLNKIGCSYFRKPVAEQLKRPLRIKKKWLRDVKVILDKYHGKENSGTVRIMRTFFTAKRFCRDTTSDLAKDGG